MPECNAKHGPHGITDVDGMALIPAGAFLMGTRVSEVPRLQQAYGFSHPDLLLPETPAHMVSVGTFYMDRHPVTNARFKAFVDAEPEWRKDRIPRHCHNGFYLRDWLTDSFPPEKDHHPVVNVCWHAAMAYALWQGKRLPTEAEWEYAARGGLTEAEFPWGNHPADPERANYSASHIGGTSPVGSYAPNGLGIYDLAGNVWEFCVDEWRADFYAQSPPLDPIAGDLSQLLLDYRSVAARRVIRGGSWEGAPINLRVAYRDSHPPEGAGGHVGFRCVRTATPS